MLLEPPKVPMHPKRPEIFDAMMEALHHPNGEDEDIGDQTDQTEPTVEPLGP